VIFEIKKIPLISVISGMIELVVSMVLLAKFAIEDGHAAHVAYHVDGDEEQHNDEGDEAYVDESQDPIHDAKDYKEADIIHGTGEEEGHLMAKRLLIALQQGLAWGDVLIEHQIEGHGPAEADDESRNDEEQISGNERQLLETNQREVLTHVLAILAIEDVSGSGGFRIIGQSNRHGLDGNSGAYVEIGNPDGDEPQDNGTKDGHEIGNAQSNALG